MKILTQSKFQTLTHQKMEEILAAQFYFYKHKTKFIKNLDLKIHIQNFLYKHK